ncbi:MAG: hypothetical protein AAFW00_00825, partial [Bacteroidota bacterium]
TPPTAMRSHQATQHQNLLVSQLTTPQATAPSMTQAKSQQSYLFQIQTEGNKKVVDTPLHGVST